MSARDLNCVIILAVKTKLENMIVFLDPLVVSGFPVQTLLIMEVLVNVKYAK